MQLTDHPTIVLPQVSNSVGVVCTQLAHFEFPLRLQHGGQLERFTLAYETYGTLNVQRDNAILICHALSGDAHVAGYYEAPGQHPGWWDDAVGPGKMFDTNRYFVVCSNVIGGCKGSTGPSSAAPDGRPYGTRFPIITIADMVAAQIHLLNHLGIGRLYAVAGGSMGGMQALQWAVSAPDRVQNVLFIASTPRSSAQNIALNAIGRRAIMADPHWNNGDYYGGLRPNAGLSVARMVGHISYMSEHSLAHKFDRKRISAYPSLHREFDVEGYLDYQGEKFVQRFDANSYLYITKALDMFDIAEGHASLAEAVRPIRARFLIVTFSSDWLYPVEYSLPLVAALRANGNAVEHRHVAADFGHDSFLVEVDTMTEIVSRFLG